VFLSRDALPIEALTIMGLTAKPNSTNPFGRFGTGLKYAIATLLREHHRIEIRIATDKFTFYTKTENFREVDYEVIHMKKEGIFSAIKPSYKKLRYSVRRSSSRSVRRTRSFCQKMPNGEVSSKMSKSWTDRPRQSFSEASVLRN
jgi:hypothetical protein